MLDDCFKLRTHPWHIFDNGTQQWKSIIPPWTAAVPQVQFEHTKARIIDDLPVKRNNIFRLITWSLHAYAPFTRERMNAALDHLYKVVLSPYTEDPPPVILMFQELREASIEQIRNTEWVQERFAITNIDTRGFDSPYETLTSIQTEDPSEEKDNPISARMTLRTEYHKCFPC